MPETLFLIKLSCLRHRFFPVNFAKSLRTPFLQNTSRRLLLFFAEFLFLLSHEGWEALVCIKESVWVTVSIFYNIFSQENYQVFHIFTLERNSIWIFPHWNELFTWNDVSNCVFCVQFTGSASLKCQFHIYSN